MVIFIVEFKESEVKSLIMKKNLLILLSIITINSCESIPENKKLKPASEKILDGVKTKLKLEQITYGFNRLVQGNQDELKFTISLIDVDNGNTNYDSINHQLFKAFQKSGYQLNKCDKIGIFLLFKSFGGENLENVRP